MGTRVRRKLWGRCATLLVLLAFFAQLAFGSVQLSLTSDEPPHIAHGYVMLATGDTWALRDHRHPPLLNILNALPLLLQPERPDPRALPHWGRDFILFVRELWPQLGPVERLAFVTRYPNMLIALLLMALVHRWARERFGRGAGLLAVAVMAFDPTMVAHAQLNTTDLGMAFFAFACLYLVLRPAYRTSWLNLAGIGATLGATLASKGSGVLLVPVVVALVGWRAGSRRQGAGGRGQEWRMENGEWRMENGASCILHLASCFLLPLSFILLVAVLVLWASYGLRLEPLSPGAVVRLPLVSHVKMVRAILSEKARTAFLWGRVREGGWWWYFPAAIAVKTPLPILVLVLWSLRNAVVKRITRHSPLATLAFWLFPAFYLAVAIRSGMNIGYRHLLPVFPFVYVAIGQIVNEKLEVRDRRLANCESQIEEQGLGTRDWELGGGRHAHLPAVLRDFANIPSRRAPGLRTHHAFPLLRCGDFARIMHHVSRFTHHVLRFTFYALLTWLIVGTLRVYPFPIAYFNELAGGPRNGYRYLVDSNVDWGQSFKALKAWMDATGTAEVRLSYYTWIDPAAYGVHYRPLPPAQGAGPLFDRRYDPEPGVYAISATPLQGVMVADTDLYDWFRHRDPVAQPGYGLLVYEVAPHPVPPRWLAQCAVPVVPLTPEAIAAGFGRADLRVLSFDCTQSWVYPGGGASPGWYALHADVAHADAPFLRVRLDAAKLGYEQRKPGVLPPFVLFEQGPGTPLPPASSGAPVEFGPLTFLGYAVMPASAASPGETFSIETWWRVDALPDRALSLMLHLAGPGGTPVVVGDGLGVPREAWRVGDVIVQRHVLSVPAEAPSGAYTPRVGVYRLDTLEHWPVRSGEQTGADSLAMPLVTVE